MSGANNLASCQLACRDDDEPFPRPWAADPLTVQRAAARTAFIRACTTCGRSLVDRGPQPDSVAKERLHDNNIPLFIAGKEPKTLD